MIALRFWSPERLPPVPEFSLPCTLQTCYITSYIYLENGQTGTCPRACTMIKQYCVPQHVSLNSPEALPYSFASCPYKGSSSTAVLMLTCCLLDFFLKTLPDFALPGVAHIPLSGSMPKLTRFLGPPDETPAKPLGVLMAEPGPFVPDLAMQLLLLLGDSTFALNLSRLVTFWSLQHQSTFSQLHMRL